MAGRPENAVTVGPGRIFRVMVQHSQVQSGGKVHDGKCAPRVAGARGKNVYNVQSSHLGGGGT
jgi:hypothetical protein